MNSSFERPCKIRIYFRVSSALKVPQCRQNSLELFRIIDGWRSNGASLVAASSVKRCSLAYLDASVDLVSAKPIPLYLFRTFEPLSLRGCKNSHTQPISNAGGEECQGFMGDPDFYRDFFSVYSYSPEGMPSSAL